MSVNYSISPLIYHCFDSRTSVSIFNAYIITKVLLSSPLSIIVFSLGYQQWRKQRSTMSHSDIVAYHMAAMELICVIACIFYFYGLYGEIPMMAAVPLYVFSMTIPGEMCLHSLTCVEHYVAVVHPVSYRGLRHSGRVRIRNISIGFVWLLCFGWIATKPLYTSNFPIIPFFSFLAFAVVVVSFCSVSVLCALIRPRPGVVGQDKKRVDQSKQRAFYTVMAILTVLWLWFVGILLCFSLEVSSLLSYNDGCVVMMFGVWFNIPSSVALPLLFLHRAGKLLCF